MGATSPELLILGLAILAGYLAGKAAGIIRLPSLIGYMVAGVLLGPSLVNGLDAILLDRLGFVTEIALGFVGFSIGAELNLRALGTKRRTLVIIILAESLLAFLIVLATVYLVTRDFALACVFGAMAPASAPAGTVAVIQEYRARGSLTRALYAVVGFDDGFAILIFGFAAALAKAVLVREASGTGASILAGMGVPAREVTLSLAVGFVGGAVFSLLMGWLRSPRGVLVVVTAFVFMMTGASAHLRLSLILANMVVGFVFSNTRSSVLVRRVAEQLQAIMPLLFVLFFCIAGAHLRLAALPSLGAVGAAYVLARSAGLLGGARLGAALGGAEEKIKKYLGLGILSQAGVAIGLALIVKHDFAQLGTAHALRIGTAVITTITATSIVFEILGPILTKIALKKAGEIDQDRPSAS